MAVFLFLTAEYSLKFKNLNSENEKNEYNNK